MAINYDITIKVNQDWFIANPESVDSIALKLFGPNSEVSYGKEIGEWLPQNGDYTYNIDLPLEEAKQLLTNFEKVLSEEAAGPGDYSIRISAYIRP